MVTPSFGLSVLPELTMLADGDRRASFVARIDPPPPPTTRPPVSLVLALDVSGSMAGEKLRAAVTSAEAIVRALSTHDTFACVTFHSQVATLVTPTKMNPQGKMAAVERLRRARPLGNTNLAEAALRSLDLANEMEGGGRVLLLTDGCPTEGVVDPAQIAHLAKGSLRAATLSTFGFGRDVNPVLLRSLCDLGRGSYAFIEQGEPPLAAIAGELGGLVSTVAAGVSVTIAPSPSVAIARVHRASGVTIEKATGAAHVELPALLGDEPVTVAFRLVFEDDAKKAPLAKVTLRARRTDDGAEVTLSEDVTAAFGNTAGSPVPEAVKEILLARAAIVLHNVSLADARHAFDLVPDLARYYDELQAEARAAGVANDPQLGSALAMIDAAKRELSAGARMEDMRHDLVSAAVSVRAKKSARLTAMHHDTFISRSQRTGWDLVEKASKDPSDTPSSSPSPAPPSPIRPR